MARSIRLAVDIGGTPPASADDADAAHPGAGLTID
jgi:hypothetical protein